jgi:hypothetical protein
MSQVSPFFEQTQFSINFHASIMAFDAASIEMAILRAKYFPFEKKTKAYVTITSATERAKSVTSISSAAFVMAFFHSGHVTVLKVSSIIAFTKSPTSVCPRLDCVTKTHANFALSCFVRLE